ncbi:MAG: hypothetical protein M1832_000138 [Thelocarpon impressellum]|nr:MAG: hypothetical protein M1832_000138 [Thelocarpon impressellum]
MDIYGAVSTAIGQIYATTIFIKRVVEDYKSYDSDRKAIQDKLDHEGLFLEAFEHYFLEDQGAVKRLTYQPAALQKDVDNILAALRRVLAEYSVEGARHGLGEMSDDDQGKIQSEGETTKKRSPFEKLKSKVKFVKTRVYDWSLFEKEKLLATLTEYHEWTERLRQTMALMLATLGAGLNEFADSETARDLRLRDVAKRRVLAAATPAEDFVPLEGIIVPGSESTDTPYVTLALYADEWNQDNKKVIIEYRKYDNALSRAVEGNRTDDVAALKAPVKNLAWLLHQASLKTESDEEALLTLRLLGYLEQPDKNRNVFLYDVPRSDSIFKSSMMTLHDLINSPATQGRASSEPDLGARFFIAHALAQTVLNIHSSGWVHKNIWSHGVLVLPSSQTQSSGLGRLDPFLMGWGSARPVLGGTALAPDFEVEPNFYRHPVRQGQPRSAFKVEHDLYALGVVLLEIGLWRTASRIFKDQMQRAWERGKLPPGKTIEGWMVNLAKEQVPREMGSAYSTAVERCLTGNFGVEDDPNDPSALLIAFRDEVVDAIAVGTKL